MTSTKFETKPLFTRQQLTALLLPLIAEQALSVTIGLADTLMVSSVGEAAVSGVSLVDTFNTLMIQIMTALATGGAVVASQYIGHREEKSARAAAAQIMFIMSSFSILVAAVVVVGRHAILRGIFGSIDADVMKYAETYFLLSALSYPFIGLYNAGAALFRAQGNSKISMMSSLVMNVVNIGGNAILIFGFKMGVMGAALASLVSRAVACCAVLFLLQKPGCMLRVTGLSALKPDGKLIQRILRVGIPAGIENGMFQIGKLSVASLTSTLGTAAIAANAVANTTSTFLNIPASAVGMAVLTVVGQCLGAGEKEPSAAGGLLRCLGHEPVGLLLRRPLGAVLVQPLAGGFGHGAGSHDVVQHRLPLLLALQLHPAQHPPRRRRRQLHHDHQHRVHVGVPCGLLLPVGPEDGRRTAQHLDGDVSRLGVPLHLLYGAFCPGKMARAEGHLKLPLAFFGSEWQNEKKKWKKGILYAVSSCTTGPRPSGQSNAGSR